MESINIHDPEFMRYIHIDEDRYALSIRMPLPSGKVKSYSRGYKRFGLETTIRIAREELHKNGIKAWGEEAWNVLIKNTHARHRCPKSVEPYIAIANGEPALCYNASKGNSRTSIRVKFTPEKAHQAYATAKQRILNYTKPMHPLMKAMEEHIGSNFNVEPVEGLIESLIEESKAVYDAYLAKKQ